MRWVLAVMQKVRACLKTLKPCPARFQPKPSRTFLRRGAEPESEMYSKYIKDEVSVPQAKNMRRRQGEVFKHALVVEKGGCEYVGPDAV